MKLNNKNIGIVLQTVGSLLLACLIVESTLGFERPAKSPSKSPGPEQQRDFEFVYSAKIQKQSPGAKLQAWFPIPSASRFQNVQTTDVQVPTVLHINREHVYGNQIGYFEAIVPESGTVSFSMKYKVQRREAGPDSTNLSPSARQVFLTKNRLVPISGPPLKLIGKQTLPRESMQLGSQLYQIVETYMSYDKSKPGYGNGDVLWACSSKTGNCTDFHSLFISLARSQGLPARFEIGFPLPEGNKTGILKGYHCWAWFYSDSAGWIPVDISEADKHPELKEYYFGKLSVNRVAFSTGRDINLVPASRASSLNYFVYPHVEVSGKALDKNQIQTEFRFADITLK